MEPRDLYATSTPTGWAGPPTAFSFSSMKRMGTCLRQWQLGRSSYGDLASYPERPSEAAEVGSIVHDLVSQLFTNAALAGYPPLGSEAFQRVVRGVDLLGTARAKLEAFAKRAAESPRSLGFRPQVTPRDVYNKVAQAFRDEYASVVAQAAVLTPIPPIEPDPGATSALPVGRLALLDQLGVLSEEEVRHPTLPLVGFIDLLVRRDGRTTVLDFKTGAANAEYRGQLLLYALMWWRSTGDLPASVELRYGARVEGWPVSEAELRSAEAETEAKIARYRSGLSMQPAAASVGPHCGVCSVRQLCDDYWAGLRPAIADERAPWVDEAVVVRGAGAKGGFVAECSAGNEVTVVYEQDVGASLGPFVAGERLRILGAMRDAEHDALRLTRASEVFRVIRKDDIPPSDMEKTALAAPPSPSTRHVGGEGPAQRRTPRAR